MARASSCLHVAGVRRRCVKPPNGASFCPIREHLPIFEALKAYLRRHGKPVAFYSDKHSIFRVSNEKAVSGNGMTQFGRPLSELNIEILCADTSQAKGRVEPAHYTLQIVW